MYHCLLPFGSPRPCPQLHVASVADVPAQRDFTTKQPFSLTMTPYFPVCQLLWPLRDALWSRGPWQDEVMAACKRTCTRSSAEQTWGYSPICHLNVRDQLLGASLPEIWSNFRNAEKAGRLGAKVFECLARPFAGLGWLNL